MGYLESHPGTKIALNQALKNGSLRDMLEILLRIPNEEKAIKIEKLRELYKKCKPVSPEMFLDRILGGKITSYANVVSFLETVPEDLRYGIVSREEYLRICNRQIESVINDSRWEDNVDNYYARAKELANRVGRELTRNELMHFLKEEHISAYKEEIINKLDAMK